MKKFKLDNVQTLSAVEMESCFWCGVGKVVNNTFRPVVGGALAIGGVVTANPALVVTGVALAVVK